MTTVSADGAVVPRALLRSLSLLGLRRWSSVGVYTGFQHMSINNDMQKQTRRIKPGHSSACTGPTSIGVLSLQTLSVQYMDLSDQLRVATHPRPTRLRRLVQSQLSGRQRVDVTVRELMKPTGVKCFTLLYPCIPASVSKQHIREPN